MGPRTLTSLWPLAFLINIGDHHQLAQRNTDRKFTHKSEQHPLGMSSSIIDVWEAVQVELRGRYSLPRFHEILQHAKSTSRWQHIGVMVATPLPGLLLILFVDVLPLAPPERGVFHQTFGLYLRLFLSMWIMAHMLLLQVQQSSPTLPLSLRRLWWISVTTGIVPSSTMVFLGWLIGFPTPFVVHIVFGAWVSTWMSNMWMAWKDTLAKDAEAKLKVFHYGKMVFTAQVAMVFLYSGYAVAFNLITSGYQVYFTLLLPVMKLAFKNWVNKGVTYMEDLAPCTIVFNVDVFHAIFVSSSMQNANSIGSVAVIMVVDAIQSMVAYYEVRKLLRHVNKLAADSVAGGEVDARTFDSRTQSHLKLKLGVIDYALDVVDTNPRIRCHPDLTQPRHRRESQLTGARVVAASPPVAENAPAHGSDAKPLEGPRVMAVRSSSVHPASRAKGLNEHQDEQLDRGERAQLDCVKSVLKMLHMIGFYVLIEFAEVIVPVINAVYLQAMVFLPNRTYYAGLGNLTRDEMQEKAGRVAIYASLEIVSFVLFCYTMDRRLRHTSTYQTLAFVLLKHARMAQTLLMMWIFFIGQMGLQHFGNDFTFQFKWLRSATP